MQLQPTLHYPPCPEPQIQKLPELGAIHPNRNAKMSRQKHFNW